MPIDSTVEKYHDIQTDTDCYIIKSDNLPVGEHKENILLEIISLRQLLLKYFDN